MGENKRERDIEKADQLSGQPRSPISHCTEAHHPRLTTLVCVHTHTHTLLLIILAWSTEPQAPHREVDFQFNFQRTDNRHNNGETVIVTKTAREI